MESMCSPQSLANDATRRVVHFKLQKLCAQVLYNKEINVKAQRPGNIAFIKSTDKHTAKEKFSNTLFVSEFYAVDSVATKKCHSQWAKIFAWECRLRTTNHILLDEKDAKGVSRNLI